MCPIEARKTLSVCTSTRRFGQICMYVLYMYEQKSSPPHIEGLCKCSIGGKGGACEQYDRHRLSDDLVKGINRGGKVTLPTNYY